MTAKIIPVAEFDCVVFGATGDLTLRKLLPALYYRFRDGQMPESSRIIRGSIRPQLRQLPRACGRGPRPPRSPRGQKRARCRALLRTAHLCPP